MVFQDVPIHDEPLRFEMASNQVVGENSMLDGAFLLPLISTEDKFAFTVPMNNLGFQDGFMEDISNTRFTFNEGGGDQEIKITIKRAVLAGYERIDMTLDLEWLRWM